MVEPDPGRARGTLTFVMVLLAIAAGLALLLSAVGLYGVASYMVAQRRGEIAIRMAVGRRRGTCAGWCSPKRARSLWPVPDSGSPPPWRRLAGCGRVVRHQHARSGGLLSRYPCCSSGSASWRAGRLPAVLPAPARWRRYVPSDDRNRHREHIRPRASECDDSPSFEGEAFIAARITMLEAVLP